MRRHFGFSGRSCKAVENRVLAVEDENTWLDSGKWAAVSQPRHRGSGAPTEPSRCRGYRASIARRRDSDLILAP